MKEPLWKSGPMLSKTISHAGLTLCDLTWDLIRFLDRLLCDLDPPWWLRICSCGNSWPSTESVKFDHDGPARNQPIPTPQPVPSEPRNVNVQRRSIRNLMEVYQTSDSAYLLRAADLVMVRFLRCMHIVRSIT